MMTCNRHTRLLAIGMVVITLWSCPLTASAWWDSGHRLVALIAWSRMDQKTRAATLKLLGQHPHARKYFTPPKDLRGETLRRQWVISQAAVWSDLVRKTDYDRPTWHYINRPLFLSDRSRRLLGPRLPVNLATVVPRAATLETGELNVIQAIRLCRQKLSAAGTSDTDRALCVTWLCHMVGDVHQPCHSTATFTESRFPSGDRGGNDVPVQGTTKPINLHMYWDSQFGGGRTLSPDLMRRAATLLADPKLAAAGRQAQGQLQAEVWVGESHRLAREMVYSPAILEAIRLGEADAGKPIPPVGLSKNYARMAREVSRRRVVEAGFRLARVLRDALQ